MRINSMAEDGQREIFDQKTHLCLQCPPGNLDQSDQSPQWQNGCGEGKRPDPTPKMRRVVDLSKAAAQKLGFCLADLPG